MIIYNLYGLDQDLASKKDAHHSELRREEKAPIHLALH